MDIRDLRSSVVEFSRDRLQQQQLPNWWRDPILVTAKSDRRFDVLPEIAASNHWLPSDLLISCRTVITFFIPFTKELSCSNIEGKFPSKSWGLSLSLTNELIDDISLFIKNLLEESGYQSELTPATYNFDQKSLTARWSHKHLAHLAGLGRFGLNAQLITPVGSAGRIGSLVTEAPLGDHPVTKEKELCLHKSGGDCLECLQICPVKAVTLNGIDRHKCNQRLQVIRKRFAAKSNFRDDIEVCAKCVSGMPCSLAAPAIDSVDFK